MSSSKDVVINCPSCSTRLELSCYASINVTVDPRLKQKVMDGSIHSQTCPACKETITIFTGFLYHDMIQRILIHYKGPNDAPTPHRAAMEKELKDRGYIFREVSSPLELIEKLSIFDAGLNDKVIEAWKSQVLSGTPGSGSGAGTRMFFREYIRSLFSRTLRFARFDAEGHMEEMRFRIKELDPELRSNLHKMDMLRNEGWMKVGSG